jgi:hypothetical protein
MKMTKFVKKFLKVEDVDEGPLKRHIAAVKEGSYGPELVLASGEILNLSVTNTITLINAYGEDSDGWTGQEVELYKGETEVKAKDEKGNLLKDAEGNLTGEMKTVALILINPISPPTVTASSLQQQATAKKAGNGKNADMGGDDIPF